MPVGCIDHLPSCVYVWRVYTSTCVITLVSLVIGVDMTWKGIMLANLWLAGNAVMFYGGAYLVWSLVK